jgi:surface antigen
MHNCTLYAAYRLEKNGFRDPGNWKNASNWAYAAQKDNILVDQTPAVGSIAQWNSVNGSDGHVAYVESVNYNSSGSSVTGITVTEDNWMPPTGSFAGGYTAEIHITAGAPVWPANFIHAKDFYYGDIVQWNGDTSAQKTSWLVGADGKRHWIPTGSVYSCLKNGGIPGPYLLPSDILTYVIPNDSGSQVPCGGDINGDGIVDITDLSILNSQYGTPGHSADINLDGTVNILDLSILESQWGTKGKAVAIKPPTPSASLQPAPYAQLAALAVSVKLARARVHYLERILAA